MKRVYVIEYKIHTNLYSTNSSIYEDRIEYYSKRERDDFISRYLELKDMYYIHDIQTYYSDLEEIKVEDIINSI